MPLTLSKRESTSSIDKRQSPGSVLFGIDKFANVMVNWEQYLAPWIREASPLSATHTMYVAGVIEIIAGIAVAIKPRYAAYIVAAWLAGIISNVLRFYS